MYVCMYVYIYIYIYSLVGRNSWTPWQSGHVKPCCNIVYCILYIVYCIL